MEKRRVEKMVSNVHISIGPKLPKGLDFVAPKAPNCKRMPETGVDWCSKDKFFTKPQKLDFWLVNEK